ncbi:unnamed protein product [Callosobruchus maculatus]|uniref:Integrase catalytic domain-containing protein n=1 Tax=Callosobruchus maculatus TaxID=64391 RepID=A0A653CS98_CALMS|nr:unnamed protein product [Callosobruchus maculatus]
MSLKELIRNRGSIKQKLIFLEKFVETIKTSAPDSKPSLTDIEIRFKNHEGLLSEFDKIQSTIESKCNEEHLEEHYLEREEFQERYYVSQRFLSDYLKNAFDSVNQSQPQSNLVTNFDPLQNMLLPKIKLPTFSGEFQHWTPFKTSFMATILNNVYLNDNQRFQFLKVSLQGYALRLIEGLENVVNPFEKAWQLLCDRFDKKHFILDCHLKALLSLQSLQRENYSSFRALLDEVSKHLTALDGLGVSKEELFDSFLIHVISSKLDKNTLRVWKERKHNTELPSINEFMDFLKDKSDILQSLDASDQKGNTTSHKFHQYSNKPTCQVNVAVNRTIKCNYCKKDHTIYKCSEFLALSVDERIKKVQSLNLCLNCLLTGHDASKCRLNTCSVCKHKHNTLLHKYVKTNADSNVETQPSASSLENSTRVQNFSIQSQEPIDASKSNHVLLSTIACKTKDAQGNLHDCRALLDCGAQTNLITEKLCKKLNIPLESTNISLLGFNQAKSHLNRKCLVRLFSNYNNYQCDISCLVVPVITCSIPPHHFDVSQLGIPSNIPLSDPTFECPRDVDLLLGASIFWELLLTGKIQLGKNLPSLYNTQFGWIVTGNIPIQNNISVCNLTTVHIPEDDQLKKFWELEELKNTPLKSADDLECEALFEKDTSRSENGQFVVKFPLKYSPQLLGDSQETAIKRFISLEKKFGNETFKILYSDFIHEYKALGHMTLVSTDSEETSYFLPHHGVLKESSITTKLRTVFDGSCKTSTGWSLNDLQYIGPKVQNDIYDILLRFRTYLFVVSADVSKMYRQIIMHPDHRHLQKIIWRDNPEQEFSIYQLNTVTYGTRAAPYLAIKCVQQLAHEHKHQFPDACQTILRDMYVDDLLSGSNDLDELKRRCKDIYAILESANFILRKWNSNNRDVISSFSNSTIENSVLNIGDQTSCSTLGIQWVNTSDVLKYKIKDLSSENNITKRYILSIIAQIYDPLGLLSPAIILIKILIQELWSLHIPWDSSIPADLKGRWIQFQHELLTLNSLNIPRNVIPKNFTIVDVHCFCDASNKAYASCVYVRSVDSDGNYQVHLLCSKTKVAPLKLLTIPKLELSACLLGAQLMQSVSQALQLQVPVIFWSDSQVALWWIQTEPSLLQVFVGNRVAKIQSLTSRESWKYVNTKNNPADIASRGVMPSNLLNNDLWFIGPHFLYLPSSEWPSTQIGTPTTDLPELRKNIKALNVISINNNDLFLKFSSIIKLRRIIALCQRFVYNLRNKTNKKLGPIVSIELDDANKTLVKLAQQESFPVELAMLQKEGFIKPNNKLSSLSLFLDDNNIMRVGGRLKNTYLPFNFKHPILLSSKHPLTILIFQHKHAQLLHSGPQLLLSSIRQFYWPVGGTALAKKVVRQCKVCFKARPTFYQCPMSSLPDARIKPKLPFDVTGLDFAGPFMILNKKGRGAQLHKCYLAIFVCFCTKAIHIEIVTDLTTENFMAAFRRFISRRGIPSEVYTDNGSTFVGAHNQLKELGHFLHKKQDSIVDSVSELNIKWHFIPPYTPNHGGLWEAAVKSTKFHLKRVLINNNVTYEEFSTLVVQIEGILNSRPLVALSNDPNDLSSITPAHFLIGRPITALPDNDLNPIPMYRLTRLRHVQKLYQQVWHQFSTRYLSQLHHQYKWKDGPVKATVDSLVLMKHDHMPPIKWPIGRIIKLHYGTDGVPRTADVKTSKGITARSIRHLCPLPLQDDLDN